ncbi:GntR family transcriptional regulator [Nitrobacteraceae bacterium AZCC 2146]
MQATLYADLARNLHRAISSGKHRPGSFLPGEHELAEVHGVSRATVRAALNMLEREGLVERRRGAGTLVLEPRPPAGFGQSVLTAEELIHYARDTRRVVGSIDDFVADTAMADVLGAAPGSRWLRISSLRIDPAKVDRPICCNVAYVAEELASIRRYLGEETTALCDLLSKHSGIRTDSIEQELQGAIVSKAQSVALGAPEGAPALRILRRYRDASGWLFLTTVGLHPADRFAYRMKLDRSDKTG